MTEQSTAPAQADSEGCCLDECEWYVEQDSSQDSGKIFGYDANEFIRRQYK